MRVPLILRAPLLVLCLAQPALGQEAGNPSLDEGMGLVERGMRLLLEGALQEVQPQMDEMNEALEGLKPALRDLSPKLVEVLRLMGQAEDYNMPEVLPNGDILIRRKHPLVPAPAPAPGGEIEL